jgi:hypothetical protein
MVVIARLVPFLNGWMITSEDIISFSDSDIRKLSKTYGPAVGQFAFAQKYHEDRKRRRLKEGF